jgi:demethylmacrocin O-methyltransferase
MLKFVKSHIKGIVKKGLSGSIRMKLRKLYVTIQALPAGNNLNKLAKIYGTDKFESGYMPVYETHLRKYKNKRIKLLEIGVGGYDNPKAGGESLKMWKKYFHWGSIFALDIYDKSTLQEHRIKIFKGSQVDKEFLNTVTDETGELDIIIDDGSHINEHIVETFKLLFPKLKEDGIYVIEDMGTSYWADYGGDSKNLNNPGTAMNYFKSLVDNANHRCILKENPTYQRSFLDENVLSVHFYRSMVFVHKGIFKKTGK